MAKELNYTPEMETEMREVYSAAETAEARAEAVTTLAEKYGKNVKSVRAKLSRMGIYISQAYVGKTGEKPETKESIAGRIANAMGENVEAFESLVKANKSVLLKIAARLESDPEE